jgi:phosphatidate cytidylyltransferase
VICLHEWKNLIPTGVVQDCKKSDDAVNATAVAKRDMKQKLLSILFDEQWQSFSDLERCQFYVFSFFSLVISTLHTSHNIPMALMFASITMRMIHFMPTFQNTTTQSSYSQSTQHYQFGLVYISVGFHYILKICRDGGPRHIGFLLFVVWMSDTGALISGRLMKKTENNQANCNQHVFFRKFLKSVSPGKTIPGLIGGIVTGPLSAILYPIEISSSSTLNNLRLLHFNHPILQKVIVGLALSIFGVVGDLAESSVKRTSGKKDSGSLLPGHGGVVDRFDSLFTSGIIYYYLVLA